MIVWLPAPPSTVIVAPSILVSLVKPFLACETVKPLLLKASWAPPDLALMEPSVPFSWIALLPRLTSSANATVYALPFSSDFPLTSMFLPAVTVVLAAVALLLTSFNCSSVAALPLPSAKLAAVVVLLDKPVISPVLPLMVTGFVFPTAMDGARSMFPVAWSIAKLFDNLADTVYFLTPFSTALVTEIPFSPVTSVAA